MLGGVDHVMNVEGFATGFGYRLDDREAKGDIRNKRAVHDIEVKPVGLTLVDHVDLAVQMQEVCSQQRWRNKRHDFK